MTKRIFMPFMAFVILTAGFFSIKSFSKIENENALLRQNVEALTGNENGGSSTNWTCWSQLTDNGGGAWQCGNPCVWHEHKGAKNGVGKCYK